MQNLIRLIFIFYISVFSRSQSAIADEIHQLWSDCKLEDEISFKVFSEAVYGYNKLKNLLDKNILTIIDFSRPSTEKRFFVIDLDAKQLLYKCYVAHGKNSGDNFATSFSNDPGSLKSSLGFFITAETYTGVHGYSLKLDGQERGINDNARVREIVIHGADYVNDDFLRKYGRLGRSWGCLALSIEIAKEIIDKISGRSCLFIYADDKYYDENSAFQDPAQLIPGPPLLQP